MDKALARRKLKDYQESMRRRVDEEHEALAQAYEALSEGTPLISLHKAITDSGFDEAGRPRLRRRARRPPTGRSLVLVVSAAPHPI